MINSYVIHVNKPVSSLLASEHVSAAAPGAVVSAAVAGGGASVHYQKDTCMNLCALVMEEDGAVI